jgi:hypothetical protein
MRLSAASPVAKTAFDALQAKRSALSVGYKPFVFTEEDSYKDLLERVTSEAIEIQASDSPGQCRIRCPSIGRRVACDCRFKLFFLVAVWM